MPWHRRPSAVCPQNELTPHFVVSNHSISRPFFPFFKIVDFFLILTILFSFSLKWQPMGVNISKIYSSYNYDSFSTFSECFLSVLTKGTYWDFEISNLNLKKRLKFKIVTPPVGKFENTTLPKVLILFQRNFFLNVPCNSHHNKSYLLGF